MSFPVSVAFRLPIGRVRFWTAASDSAAVCMPKTAMHENDGPILGKHQIRTSGQIASMQAKPVAHPVNEMPDNAFGCRIA